MLGIFCATRVMADEDYREYVRKRCVIYVGLMVIGAITAVIAAVAEYGRTVEISDMVGIYAGMGAGLIAGGLILLIRNLRLLRDEKKLREARISGSDERNIQIAALAAKAALAVLLVGIYFAILIGGLWYPILAKILGFLIILFLFSYIVAYKVISMRI